jgi:cytochrome c oxidase subunit 2
MTVALLLAAVAIGSVAFHLFTPVWWTPIASNWVAIDDTMTLMFWITGIASIAVILFMAFCVYRFHHREGRRAVFEPESRRLEFGLGVATAFGVGAMLAPGLLVWEQFINPPRESMVLEAVGRQWQWAYRFPGKDNVLGASGIGFVSADNPLGIDPDDPHGRDDIVVDGGDLHLPLNRPVKLLLRSLDVIHNFYVPEFRAKMDLLPGMVTYFWLEPRRAGSFELLCLAYCGIGHPQMRGNVVVEPEAEFQEWLAAGKTFAQTQGRASVEATPKEQ